MIIGVHVLSSLFKNNKALFFKRELSFFFENLSREKKKRQKRV